MVGRADWQPLVLKLGGSVLEDASLLKEIGAELSLLESPTIVVHGGGSEVNRWCLRFDLPVRTIEGLRVTDAATLEVVTAVLAGLVNKRTVAHLQSAGLQAVGLSALDGGICDVEPSPDAELLGHVGRVRSVQSSLLEALLGRGMTPVIASIGACGKELFNINADDVAAGIAVAMANARLILLTDVPGLVVNGEVVPELRATDIDDMLETPAVSHGMRAKLRSVQLSIAGGVESVHLARWAGSGSLRKILSGDGYGTRFTAAMEEEPSAQAIGDPARD
jgi:acetylglutamate kinase